MIFMLQAGQELDQIEYLESCKEGGKVCISI